MSENLQVTLVKMEGEINSLKNFIKEQSKEKIKLIEKVCITMTFKSKSLIFINIIKGT